MNALLSRGGEPGKHVLAYLSAALDAWHVGVVVCGSDARTIWCNRAARSILKKGDGVQLRGGRLVARGDDAGPLDAAIRSAASLLAVRRGGSSWLHIERGTGARPLELMIQPAGSLSLRSGAPPAAIVYLSDPGEVPELPAEPLQALWGLSKAETGVARELAAGNSSAEIARALNVSVNTVRAHLKNIFRKTGTRRQGELLVLLRSSIGSVVPLGTERGG